MSHQQFTDARAVPPIWRALVSEINGGRIPDGEPGIRDVDAPCDDFVPAGKPWQDAAGDGACDTDGHYVCRECVHISQRELRRRRDQCEDSGGPLTPGDVCRACDAESPRGMR